MHNYSATNYSVADLDMTFFRLLDQVSDLEMTLNQQN
jgi:hypothetical protein